MSDSIDKQFARTFDYTQLTAEEVREITSGITEDGYYGRFLSTNMQTEAILLLLREVRLIRTFLAGSGL